VARVGRTPQALADLQAAYEFVARDSVHYAEALTDRLFDAAGRLELFPRSGRVVPEIGREDIRELIVSGYRVVYRVSDDEVEILTVTHATRPPEEVDPPGEEPP
jgi:toxin ParE1/3/4